MTSSDGPAPLSPRQAELIRLIQSLDPGARHTIKIVCRGTEPWEIQVDVYNGTGAGNAAASMANKVAGLAYQIGNVGNAKREDYTKTLVYYAPGGQEIAARLANELGVGSAALPGGDNPNRLVVIVPKDNPGKVAELKDLARPGVKLVTTGPGVPIGVYTRDMLDRMAQDPGFGPELRSGVERNIVSREPNVRQVVAKVNLGEADAAVVYRSDVTPEVAANVRLLDVPDRFNTSASYPIAVLEDASHPAAARAFMAYVLSPEGQAVLEKWGFLPADGGGATAGGGG